MGQIILEVGPIIPGVGRIMSEMGRIIPVPVLKQWGREEKHIKKKREDRFSVFPLLSFNTF